MFYNDNLLFLPSLMFKHRNFQGLPGLPGEAGPMGRQGQQVGVFCCEAIKTS